MKALILSGLALALCAPAIAAEDALPQRLFPVRDMPARLDTGADIAILRAPEVFGLPTPPVGHSYVRVGAAVLEIVDATGVVIRRVGPRTGLER